jgi:Resolvase, N terminal domain
VLKHSAPASGEDDKRNSQTRVIREAFSQLRIAFVFSHVSRVEVGSGGAQPSPSGVVAGGPQAIGVGFVSLNEGIDLGTPAGRLQLHILAALSEFERCRIQERVRAGLARARAQGTRLGRPRVRIAGPQADGGGGIDHRGGVEAPGRVPLDRSPNDDALG